MQPLKLSELAPASALETLLARIEQSVAAIGRWNDGQQRHVAELRSAIDALHAEAMRRMIAGLREVPAAEGRLRELLGDEVIYAVLRRLGVLRASVQERIDDALQAVRPQLLVGGGDVELAEVLPPLTVRLRWLGACAGDAATARHLRARVRGALRDACPDITIEDRAGPDDRSASSAVQTWEADDGR